MAAGRYDKACAEEMMRASNIDPVPVADCMGDIHENSFSPILEVRSHASSGMCIPLLVAKPVTNSSFCSL